MNFRRFPIALYSYVFGAAGLGFSVALILQEPTTTSLITTIVSASLVIIGYILTRPYMRDAKSDINSHIRDLNDRRALNEVEHDTNP